MTFGNERVFYVLAVLAPLLILFLHSAWRKRKKDMALFVQSRLLEQLTVGVSEMRRKSRMALMVLAVTAILCAMARPRWGYDLEEVSQAGLDIIAAIDTSRSMLAVDINPSPLARAKLAALELMALAKTDRLGVEAFAGSAFLQCPLTFDDEAFRESVNALDVNIIPQGGTALAEAIQTARASFKSEEGNTKVLLLFTDGEDHEQGVVEAAKEAAAEGVHIFTIGVGTPEGEMLRQADEKGVNAFIKDEEGNAVKSRLDEKTLRDIAAVGKGFYLQLRGANTMDMLYQRGLAPLLGGQSDGKNTTRTIRHYVERFQWPLGLAIALLIAETLIPDRKRPNKNDKPAGREKVSWMTAALLCLLASIAPVHGSAAKAFDSYKNQKYESAWQEYEKLLSKKPKDPRLAYNAGAAAFQAEYQEAETRFSDALVSPDVSLQERAYYNLGNSLYRQGEHAEDPAAKQDSWEKAVRQYDSALKLDPKDEDAAFNKEMVKKKIEELKQQQQQDKNSKNDKQDDKDKKEDKDNDKKDDRQKENPSENKDKKDQQKDGNQKEDKQNPEQKNQDPSQQKQDKKKEDAGQDQKKQDARQPQKQSGQDKGDDKQQQGGAAPAAQGAMSPDQARQLLDMQKSNEKIFPYILKEQRSSNKRIYKEW